MPVISANLFALSMSLILRFLIQANTADPEHPITSATLVAPPALFTAIFTLFEKSIFLSSLLFLYVPQM